MDTKATGKQNEGKEKLWINVNSQLRFFLLGAGAAHMILFCSMLIGIRFEQANWGFMLYQVASSIFYIILWKNCSLNRFAFLLSITILEIMGNSSLSIFFYGDDMGMLNFLIIPVVISGYVAYTEHSGRFRVLFISGIVLIVQVFYFYMHLVKSSMGERSFYLPEMMKNFVLFGSNLLMFVFLAISAYSYSYRIRKETLNMERSNRELSQQAVKDPMLNIYNRRGIQQVFDRAELWKKETGLDCTIIIGDIDHFKQINDHYGHDAGDLILKLAAKIMKDAIRGEDAVCRWGGEEFLFVIFAPLKRAAVVGERIRKSIETQDVLYQGNMLHVTITFGCAEVKEDIDSAILEADGKLYRGKKAGRNRVSS